MSRGAAALVVLLLGAGSCADGAGPAADAGPACAKGFKAQGAVCVPALDSCQGDEAPQLGGGCKRVGVKLCASGWELAAPPGWTCKPIGPPRTCLSGWARVKGGWCEPILPRDSCPAGTMEVIGQSSCQPVGQCGSGTWGAIQTSAATIYVDHNHAGVSGKGTKIAPYKTIGAAMKQAVAGDHIAVAAGTYNENVELIRKVHLEGRCASKVIISGDGAAAAVKVYKWATGAQLSGVTITGAGVGLKVDQVTATARRVVVSKSEGFGVHVVYGGALTLSDSLVAQSRTIGAALESGALTLERSVVRGTRPRAKDSWFGRGIDARQVPGRSETSQLILRDSVVADNRDAGIYLFSSRATLTRSVVRSTRPRAADLHGGRGVAGAIEPGLQTGSELTLSDCLIAHSRDIGLYLASSRATLERTVIRDTEGRAADGRGGMGVHAQIQIGQTRPPELTLRQSLVTGNRFAGVALYSAKGTLQRTVVRGTRGQTSDKTMGVGLQAVIAVGHSAPSKLTVQDSLITGNRNAGINLAGSELTLERSVVQQTLTQASDDQAGVGIHAEAQGKNKQSAQLTVRDSLVAGNRTLGISLVASNMTIERSVVRDTRTLGSAGRYGTGIQAGVDAQHGGGSQLTARHCVLLDNHHAGVSLYGSSAKLDSCAVLGTRADGRGKYGDAVVVSGKSTLNMDSTVLERSARAGMLFDASGGAVRRSRIGHNLLAVDLEHGANPVIGDDNQLLNNKVNKVSTGEGLEVPPPPPAPNPLGPDAGVGAQ